jgi:alkylhydroperoxidase family enzyme
MFERLREHFSAAQIVELTLRIALTGAYNRLSEALALESEFETLEPAAAAAK